MGFLGAGIVRVVGASLALLAALVVSAPSHAQQYCSAVADAADGGASSCRDALLCGIECADTLCADKRARCAAPEADIVRGRIDIQDVDFSSARMTTVDGIAKGVAVLSGAIRLYYRDTRPDVEMGTCTEVEHDGLDTEPAICPDDTFVVGLRCASNLCEAFSLSCCAFSAPETAPEPVEDTGDETGAETGAETGTEAGTESVTGAEVPAEETLESSD